MTGELWEREAGKKGRKEIGCNRSEGERESERERERAREREREKRVSARSGVKKGEYRVNQLK